MQPGRIVLFAGVFLTMCAVPAHAATVTIVIDKLVNTPAEATAKVGDTIEWDNRDFLQHTATAKDGSWDLLLPPHKKAGIVVKQAGTFDYFCKFHPNMKGKLTVMP